MLCFIIRAKILARTEFIENSTYNEKIIYWQVVHLEKYWEVGVKVKLPDSSGQNNIFCPGWRSASYAPAGLDEHVGKDV